MTHSKQNNQKYYYWREIMEFTEDNTDLIEQLANIDLNLVQKIIQEGLWFEFLFKPRSKTNEPKINEPKKEFEWWWFGVRFENW